MDIDLLDFRLFVRVAAFRNITRAAEDIPVAVSAASARIKAIEDGLKTKLLERRSKGVELTPAGQAFLIRAQTILKEASNLQEDLLELDKGTRGIIHLCANTNSTAEFLPDLLGRFLAKHPEINIRLEERLSQDVVRTVREGKADIGVIAGNINTHNLLVTPFRRDRLVVIAPNNHPLAKTRVVDFAKALDWDFVGMDHSSAVQKFIVQMAAGLGRNLDVRIHLQSFNTICRMVGAGVGIAIIPLATARRMQRATKIRIVHIEEHWALRELKLVVRSLPSLAPHCRQLFDHLLRE